MPCRACYKMSTLFGEMSANQVRAAHGFSHVWHKYHTFLYHSSHHTSHHLDHELLSLGHHIVLDHSCHRHCFVLSLTHPHLLAHLFPRHHLDHALVPYIHTTPALCQLLYDTRLAVSFPHPFTCQLWLSGFLFLLGLLPINPV